MSDGQATLKLKDYRLVRLDYSLGIASRATAEALSRRLVSVCGQPVLLGRTT